MLARFELASLVIIEQPISLYIPAKYIILLPSWIKKGIFSCKKYPKPAYNGKVNFFSLENIVKKIIRPAINEYKNATSLKIISRGNFISTIFIGI